MPYNVHFAVMPGPTQADSPEPLLLSPVGTPHQHPSANTGSTQPVVPVAATAEQAAAPHLTPLLLGDSCCCCVAKQLDHPQPAATSRPLHRQSPALSSSTACIAVTQERPQLIALASAARLH